MTSPTSSKPPPAQPSAEPVGNRLPNVIPKAASTAATNAGSDATSSITAVSTSHTSADTEADSALSRRRFFLNTGAVALATTAVPLAQAQVQPHGMVPANPIGTASSADVPPDAEVYLYFNADEAAFIEAAVQRLIPPDDIGPSALEAGVPHYMDRQLNGAWGAGDRLYRSGPWLAGTPMQGYQLPFTPAELFRTALRGLRADETRSGRVPFEAASGNEQDLYLTQLQAGERDLDGVPSNVFFESLLGMTIEGYFSDPAYGGNRGMAAWRMIGFPGAYGAYYDLVDQHGIAFTAAPRSIASGRGHGGHSGPGGQGHAQGHAQGQAQGHAQGHSEVQRKHIPIAIQRAGA